jgi:3-isopropylmalate dehydrogenase
MSSYRISVLPGDGIGPEVMAATLRVLQHAAAKHGPLNLQFAQHDAGADLFRRRGCALPDEVLADCRAADAVLLAAIGLPDVRRPDGTEVQPEMMMGLRRSLDLYAAVRPIKLYPGLPTPLRSVREGIDLVILRENTEGLFASFGGGAIVPDQVATDTLVVTRRGTERVVNFAFRLAQRRRGRPVDGRKRVTCVDKANVFRSLAFFRQVFFEVASRHPAIASDAVYVDAMSLYLVQNPWDFDVLVTENMCGDILSDLGAGLVGGLGMAPSGEIGEEHALFQPSHGSAPQLAGRNIANPIAMILSAGMMLEWLSEKHHDACSAAAAAEIHRAVEHILAEGRHLPADLGGKSGTQQVADAVIAAMADVEQCANSF